MRPSVEFGETKGLLGPPVHLQQTPSVVAWRRVKEQSKHIVVLPHGGHVALCYTTMAGEHHSFCLGREISLAVKENYLRSLQEL